MYEPRQGSPYLVLTIVIVDSLATKLYMRAVLQAAILACSSSESPTMDDTYRERHVGWNFLAIRLVEFN
jgi:hypothetical protein